MKKYISGFLTLASLMLAGCNTSKAANEIIFGTSADYPPFEFYKGGKIVGFDIELADLLAQELKKNATFKDMQFSTVLAALQNGTVDAAISTITLTSEREKNFDFSDIYYVGDMAVVYQIDKPITTASQLVQKKVACQLGTTMEIWLREHATGTEIIAMDNNNLAIESVKAAHVEGAFVDTFQAREFSKNNPGLAYSVIAKSDKGYSIAVKKGSPLKNDINLALKTLKEKGVLKELEKRWLETDSE